MNFCQPRAASAQKVGQMEAYLTVACILSGFGIAVLMFRIQRELHMQERHPDSPNWLAWADYLVIGSIALSLLLVVLPLVALPSPGKQALAFAAASCAAATILLAGYPPAILDHYRIEIGANRKGDRNKGEPIEKVLVLLTAFIAVAVFAGVVAWRLAL